MIQKLKNFLKRILPPPVRTFMREIERVLAEIRGQGRKTATKLESLERRVLEQEQKQAEQHAEFSGKVEQIIAVEKERTERFAELEKEKQRHFEMLSTVIAQQQEQIERMAAMQGLMNSSTERLLIEQEKMIAQGEGLMSHIKEAEDARIRSDADARKMHREMAATLEKVRLQTVESRRYASETVWAEIFNNTITGSTWLKDKAFSPGRWAAGYQALYVIYRVLNEMQPKRILELGIGQSTRMIAQYAASHDGVEHYVVEHDTNWIETFGRGTYVSDRTEIVQLELEMAPYKEAKVVRGYKGFKSVFEKQVFDFIFVDAPLGGDMWQYSRVDVLHLLPTSLSRDFVILVDDCQRNGEMRTVKEIISRLDEAGIGYAVGNYSGKKDCTLICAKHIDFLTTM